MSSVHNFTMRQFVSNVISFTSQYSETSWRAQNLVGPPILNGVYGDSSLAWCPSTSVDDQLLELYFDTPV